MLDDVEIHEVLLLPLRRLHQRTANLIRNLLFLKFSLHLPNVFLVGRNVLSVILLVGLQFSLLWLSHDLLGFARICSLVLQVFLLECFI